MGEQGQDAKRRFKLIPGGGRGEQRTLDRVLGRRHAWLWKVGALAAVLAGGAFLLAPAFGRRAPSITPEEVAAAMAASEGLGPLVTGLTDVLDLDASQAAALKRTLERLDAEAAPVRREREASLQVLRGAASGSGAEAAAVETALAGLRGAQEGLQRLDRALVEEVSRGLSPSQQARVALILGGHFQRPAPPGQRAPAHEAGPTDPHGTVGAAPAPTAPAPTAPATTAPATTAPAAQP